jgi:hypothetical protein
MKDPEEEEKHHLELNEVLEKNILPKCLKKLPIIFYFYIIGSRFSYVD